MLTTKIKSLQLAARKERDQIATNLFTTLLGELTTMEVNMRCIVPDSETIKVVQKFIKNNDFTISSLESTGVVVNTKEWDQLQKLKDENILLATLLPQQLNEKELRALIAKELFQDIEPPTMQDIMKFLKENYAGRYDGKLASTIAKNLIG